MILNIIHPYTFKLKDDTLEVGPSSEPQRDAKFSLLVNSCLEKNVRTIHHKCFNGEGKFAEVLRNDMMALGDPNFDILYDERIDVVSTSINGTPMPDNKPENIDDKLWDYICTNFTLHSDLGKLLDNFNSNQITKSNSPNDIFLIGGFLQNCIANFAGYCHKFYRKPGQNIFYIPELCVYSKDKNLIKIIDEKFKELNIFAKSYDETLDIVHGL